MTMDASGVKGLHHKNHPVHFFADGTKGETAGTVATEYGKIGTPICFDCDYEIVIRRMTAAGAEVILSPVMDGRAWTARQHDQHAELFRIRACENGRWLVSSASSGVSQAIDPRGQVHARLPAMAEGSLVAEIRRETKLTFYTRAGWLVPRIVLVLAIFAWAMVLIRKGEPQVAPTHGEPGV
jgi:apolipoprotein N-acyltransferase